MMSAPHWYVPVKQASYVAGRSETGEMPLPCRPPWEAASGISSRDKILSCEVLYVTGCGALCPASSQLASHNNMRR